MFSNHDSQGNGRPDTVGQGNEPAGSRLADEILKQRLSSPELAAGSGEASSWPWHGYVGAGKITLLTSQWKSGKTTLLSILLARMGKGGELAGLAVAPGSAAVFSEESRGDWEARCRRLQIDARHSFFCRPFPARPTMEQWHGLIDATLELRRRETLDLMVIDSLGIFLPGNNENNAAGITKCLLPLRKLTAARLGVLLVHHPRKGVNLAGQAARGSGALASFVDILIEMYWYGKAEESDRRRWLRAYSRHDETRRSLVLELTPAGNDYLAHDTPDDAAGLAAWHVLCLVLQDASERLTQRQIREQWPEDFPRPDQATIWRGLKRGLEQGLILQQGTGRRNDPYRYWLPGKEDEFPPGLNASPEALERFRRRHQEKFFEAIGMDPKAAEAAAAERPSDKGNLQAPAAPPALAAAQTVVEPAVPCAPLAPVEPPAAPSAASLVARPHPEPLQVAPVPEPVPRPVPAPTPKPAPRRRSRRKPVARAPATAVTAQEAKPVAPTTPSGQPAGPTPPPSAAPAALPTPAPVLSVDEERRRFRRWPYP